MLVDVREQDQLRVQLLGRHPRMVDAFRAAGRGDISAELEEKIAQHQSSIYLRFAANFVEERTRVLKYTELARQLGGMAIKIESSGVGHAWERWFHLLASQNEFDWYCAVVMLLADEGIYYSCGMHHFGLADAAIGKHLAPRNAGNLLNKFNYWRIVEPRELKSGDIFRLDDSNRRYRVDLKRDQINPTEDLFHNPQGLWFLTLLNTEDPASLTNF